MKTILLSIALAFAFTSYFPAQNNTVQRITNKFLNIKIKGE